jgi:hypothetical protein
MGRAIGAVVPIEFNVKGYHYYGKKKVDEAFHNRLLDFYDIVKESTEDDWEASFKIKEDILIKNYRDFLLEFYDLIGEDFYKKSEIPRESEKLYLNDINSFYDVFSKYDVACIPRMRDGYYASVCGCNCTKSWCFYMGSYKAWVEVYTTFMHFERILAKTMENPLAKITKFCECG